MRILVSDWGAFDEVLPVALKYQAGMEVQEYTSSENIGRNRAMAEDIGRKIKTIPLRGFHGPYAELVPAGRDRKVREVARSRFQDAFDLAQRTGAQHPVPHSGHFPKTYPRGIWIQNSYKSWVGFLAEKSGQMNVHLENVYEDDYSDIVELVG
jgi:sugar phosphate isomerase/epimerase